MKMFLTLAAVAAALATSSLAHAGDRAGGHWERQTRPTPGPTKSHMPQQVRVWVRDGDPEVADCNCSMMNMNSADCMMHVPAKGKVPSAG